MRHLLCLLLLFLSVIVSGSEKKNVLIIVADDLNCAISPYGDPNAITPNLDRLAKRGTTFLNAYCQQAVCNPSRSSFLTGRYPDATGVGRSPKIISHRTARRHNTPTGFPQRRLLFAVYRENLSQHG